MQTARITGLWHSLFDLRPGYQVTAALFLRLLALIYLIAFASLYPQITGLAGADGILPFADLLSQAYQLDGWLAWFKLPNLFWINHSDLALRAACMAGCVFSVLMLLGRYQRLAAIMNFVLYLSLFHAGQIFLSFQWDSLLLEAGFLAIFLVSGPTLMLILLYEWLLFRLRLMSGLSKLISGDSSWSDFSALHYYFETQPLPHIGAWYAQHWPQWIQQFGVGLTFFSELLVPFLIFMPRPYRFAAAFITIVMQLLIIATSNHAFVNILVIALCVLLLDDKFFRGFLPNRLLAWLSRDPSRPGRAGGVLTLIFAVMIVFVSSSAFYMYSTRSLLPQPVVAVDDRVQNWGLGHIFHVFPTMQTSRQELVIEGSQDGEHWQPYRFKFKPGDPATKPAFITPYHPRLDWMMWFVPTQSGRQLHWFRQFQNKLKTGSPAVLSLLADNPFADKPPRFLRVKAYQYAFTTPQARRENGNWWQRDYLGLFPYVPPRRP